MIFKRFRYTSIFYIVLIVLLTASGVYIIFNTYFWLTSVWIFIINIVVIYWFLKFISREHKKLSNFLVSIDQEDFSPPYSKGFEDVDFNNVFKKLTDVISKLRDDAQINYHYLQTIINHVNVAIVCADSNEKIVISNIAAKKLFQKSTLRNITSLNVENEDLQNILSRLDSGEKKLIKIKIKNELFNYSIQLTEFKLLDEIYKIFSFQNVQSELEQNELASWQKLTRVITHEIMNSAIPISNLSGLIYGLLYNKKGEFIEEINSEVKKDTREGLKTIENRSKGLVNFVDATRNFTKIPKPEIDEVNVEDIFKRVISLLKVKFSENDINVKVNMDSGVIKLLADRLLIEQVLINIMLNSIDALKSRADAQIVVEAKINSENHILISISDNGVGIEEEDIENIFVPFYTTKKSGSGIGLSLARQIMFLHKGNISVKSEKNIGTTITLTF